MPICTGGFDELEQIGIRRLAFSSTCPGVVSLDLGNIHIAALGIQEVIPVCKVEFVLAELGINRGLVGAALWAKRRCE